MWNSGSEILDPSSNCLPPFFFVWPKVRFKDSLINIFTFTRGQLTPAGNFPPTLQFSSPVDSIYVSFSSLFWFHSPQLHFSHEPCRASKVTRQIPKKMPKTWVSCGSTGSSEKKLQLEHKFTQRWKFRHSPLACMLMESRVKFCSQQNISGPSQQNSVAAFSQTTEADGDLNGSMLLIWRNQSGCTVHKGWKLLFKWT